MSKTPEQLAEEYVHITRHSRVDMTDAFLAGWHAHADRGNVPIDTAMELIQLRAENAKLLDEVERLKGAEAFASQVLERETLLINQNMGLKAENARYRSALELIATPKRADGTYNRSREACEKLAREALKGSKQMCAKCQGTGWHTPKNQIGTVHSYVCAACCKHDKGRWQLMEDYGEDNGKWCCRAGCGTLWDEPETDFDAWAKDNPPKQTDLAALKEKLKKGQGSGA